MVVETIRKEQYEVERDTHYSRKNKNYKRRERMLAEKAQRQARLENDR